MNNAESAKEMLVHYFRMIAMRAGIQWDSDNEREIEGIVDDIIAASGRPAQRKEQ